MLVGRGIHDQVEKLKENNLEDLHLQTVGVKVWVTERGVRDVEVARLSCGGHGEFWWYSVAGQISDILPGNMAAAGLGSIYAQLSATRTYEGDSYVLSQQIGNAVNKHWKK